MRRLVVAAAVACGVFFTLSTKAEAAFEIRATEFSGAGAVQFSKTITDPGGPGTTVTAIFSGFLGDFTVTVVTNTSSTGPGFSAHDATINVTYKGPTGASGTSDKLLIEVLGTAYIEPAVPSAARISSNGSPSSSLKGGANADSIVMTSGVLTDVALSGIAGTTLGGQLGMTTGTGAFVAGVSGVLAPNPAENGGAFAIFNPFSFYQTYTYDGFTSTGAVTLSAGTEVDAVAPAPASLILAIAGLPILGGYCWVRRRKSLQMA